MPPPVPDMSDDESTGESIPYDDAPEAKRESATQDDDEDEDEDETAEEDVYTVENIVSHKWAKNGDLLFHVKWHGYDDPADMTFEPEENLDGAKEIVEEYFRKLGGRPEKPQAQPKKRKSMGRTPKSTPEKMPEPKKRRKSRAETATETPDEERIDDNDGNESDGTSTWMPKSRNWEGEVESVETIIREPGTSNLLAFLNWKNGKKSKVSIELCYDKCPKKMLAFYESHLVFKDG